MTSVFGIAITFAAVILIIILAVNFFFRRMDKRDPDYIKKFDSIPDLLDVCNFGSSHIIFLRKAGLKKYAGSIGNSENSRLRRLKGTGKRN